MSDRRPPRCRGIQCGWPQCPGGELPVTRPGQCCPSCPRPPPPGRGKPGSCPFRRTGFGLCINECFSDFSCRGRQKCCSNGCGRECMRPSWGRCTLIYNYSWHINILGALNNHAHYNISVQKILRQFLQMCA